MSAPIHLQQMDYRLTQAPIAGAHGRAGHAVSDRVEPEKTEKTEKAEKDKSGFSFDDLLDIVNPLHHIPVISTLYRALSGDTIKPVSRLAGGGLFGGLIGFASTVANLAFEKLTGKDFGDTALALITGPAHRPGDPRTETRLANAAPARLSALAMAPDIAAPASLQQAQGKMDQLLAQRAVFAYQQSRQLSQDEMTPDYGLF